MSNPNEQPKSNNKIDINENGEVVIKDAALAEALQELSPEELDAIAGGIAKQLDDNGNCNCAAE
jgi:hypothetical protein